MSTMNKKSWQMGIAGFSYASLAVAPVYASDVEIYTKAVANSALSPVVMMMLDTSGSMDTKDCKGPITRKDGKNYCAAGYYTETRMSA